MISSKAVVQYLTRYADPRAQIAAALLTPQLRLGAATVIPACRENADFLTRFLALSSFEPHVLVLILNCQTRSAQQATRAPLEWLRAHSEQVATHEHGRYSLFAYKQHYCLVADLTDPTDPTAQVDGVGDARKLGMDIALHCWQSGCLADAWVRNTDADVIWPLDYLQRRLPIQAAGACVLPFRHTQSDDDPAGHIFIYDCWLRYYVASLRWAGSPWAFHTIGSTLALHLPAYAQCRGFPRKQAGEDFYLLNKISKVAPLHHAGGEPLLLSGRCSDRTPFGTGQAVGANLSGVKTQAFYHPHVFVLLRQWYETLSTAWPWNPERLLRAQAEPLALALRACHVDQLLAHAARQSHTHRAALKHFHTGFDANRTRQCIHWLQRSSYSPLSPQQWRQHWLDHALPSLPAMPDSTTGSIPSFATLSERLATAETNACG